MYFSFRPDNEFHQELRFSECIKDSLGLNGLLESALISIFQSVVPFTEVLCFQGTIGITVDRKQTLLLHFSNAVNKNATIAGWKEESNNEEPEEKSDESCFQSIIEDNFPHLQEKRQKTGTNDLKQSLLQMFLRGKKTFYSDEEITTPSQKDCSWDVHREGPISERRKGRPQKNPLEKTATPVIGALSRYQTTDRSTAEVDQESTQVQNVGKFYVNIEPDGWCRGDMNLSTLEESEHCGKGKYGILSLSQESDEKQATDCRSRTLLRQLLQPEKPIKNKPQKRKFIDSEECLAPHGEDQFPATLLNDGGHSLHSSGDVLFKQEGLNLCGISSLRSCSLKIDPAAPRSKPLEDDVTSGNRASDSILCRLLTSSVSMYNTTEVEQMRKTPHCSPNHSVGNRVEGFCNDGYGPSPTMHRSSEALVDDEVALVNVEKSICTGEESKVSIQNPSSASLQSWQREVLLAQNNINVDRITANIHSSSVSSAPDVCFIKTEPSDFRECSTVNLSSGSSIQWE